MRISVAICTWNRAASLARTLETVQIARLAAQSPIEVIVVNNNCTDTTDDVIARLMPRIPLVRVFEPNAGLSNARNAAIAAATGDYIVWTDDDVCVDPLWLAAYASAFASYPEASFFGGPIIPRFEGTPPPWLLRAWPTVAEAYAKRDFGESVLALTADRLPFGANFAVRIREQRCRRFDPRFGRRPSDYWLVGEESQLMLSLLAGGCTGWWVPGARVEHRIPPERQTLEYLRSYYMGCGRTTIMEGIYPRQHQILGLPIAMWQLWLRWELRYWWLRLTKGPERWLPKLAERSQARGWLQETLHHARKSRRKCPTGCEN